MTGRRVYVPDNARRPVLTDDWHVIVRRTKAAKLMRQILYGGHEVKVREARIKSVWAWTVREFVMLRDFRYSDLLNEARRFVHTYGHVEPLPAGSTEQEVLDLDLELVKAFESYLKERRTELQTWKKHPGVNEPVSDVIQRIAVDEVKRLAILGICGSCGDDLPCAECGLPAVKFDGQGGLVPA